MKIVKLLFAGDSIGDCNRARPIGEAISKLGDSYIGELNAYIWGENPKTALHIMNACVSGDTSGMLLKRFDTDIIDYAPDYCFIMIGINDCWRRYDSPLRKGAEDFIVKDYPENIGEMVKKCKNAGIIPVLLSPFFAALDKNDEMRKDCDKCNEILKKIAADENIRYIDIQEKIDYFLENGGNPYLLSQDRVHPNKIGRALIAHTILADGLMRELIKINR